MAWSVDVLLGITVLAVWIGVVGMLRMRSPMQALHFLALPGAIGAGAVVLAIFLRLGFHAASWKSLIIAGVMLGINSVVAHATARAFRVRSHGEWRHHHGDDIRPVAE